MSTVVRFGLAGVLGVGLLSVSTGLAASPPAAHPAWLRVQVSPLTPISAAPPVKTRSPAAVANLITPEAIEHLVLIRAAHPRPAGPQTECVARTVYHEASNQILQGQLAVAQVIINRTRNPSYPRTACAVVGQPGQFAQAPVAASVTASLSWRTALAISAIAQDKEVGQVAPGALYFHAAYVRPAWSRTHERIAQIGDHIFYR